MKVDLIEAKTAKELTEHLNNLVGHIKKEYNDEPYVEIFQPVREGYNTWRAFVTYGENKTSITERQDNMEKWMRQMDVWAEDVDRWTRDVDNWCRKVLDALEAKIKTVEPVQPKVTKESKKP